MDVTIEEISGVSVIRLNGTLDARTADGFREQLSKLIAGGATKFVVEASRLSFVDSRGLGTLIYLRRCARQGKGDVRIVGATRIFTELLSLTGLSEFFDQAGDVETALERFKQS